jgi:hypothetical protein
VFDELEREGKIDTKKLVMALYEKAVGGDTGAIREFLERRVGKVRYEFAVEGQLGSIVQQLEQVSDAELRAFASGGPSRPLCRRCLLAPATRPGQIRRNTMDTEKGDEILELRALARAVVLQRQPEQCVVYMDDERKPIYDPFVRYASKVVVLPRPLSVAEWEARYAHLAVQGKQKHVAAPTATATRPPTAASVTTERRSADDSPGPERAAAPVGIRRRSRFRP